MAHPVTGPAVQRAERVLKHRIKPAAQGSLADGGAVPFVIEATEPVSEPIPYTAALRLPRQSLAAGSPWGPPWRTTWLRLTADVPDSFGDRDVRAVIDLGFTGRSDGFQAEGLVYLDGRPIQAVQPDRRTVPLGRSYAPGDHIELWVEAVSNPVMSDEMWDLSFRPTRMGDPATAGENPLYVLRRADLAVHHSEVDQLAIEMQALIDLAIDLADDDRQRPRIFTALERMIAALDLDDIAGSATRARAGAHEVLSVGSAPGSHRLVAVGHAHLDTAWLWPTREARRKASRTFVNAVGLLERFPQFRFAHSQAQHYAWVRDDHPEVFERVVESVHEGRWEPLGGMWVEADLNLSGGESLVRQFLVGQRHFRQWFGRYCEGAFLPDDFGYPAQIPQIARRAGCEWFFTQKLSWNETNRFPHHTFWWEALDGSRLFTHFSPIETYNSSNTPGLLRFAARNFADHVGASTSLVCYGHGDGGGGPTEAMISRIDMAADLHGVPPTRHGTVSEFFAETIDEYAAQAPVWVGEMYFEKHRGTYTSQIGTKRGNRLSESLLHEAELWSASTGRWPAEELDDMWRAVLTEQFHDILPGSSIAWVHRDAEEVHARVHRRCEDLIADAVGAASESGPYVLNPGPFAVRGVETFDGRPQWVDTPALGSSRLDAGDRPGDVDPVVVGDWRLSNGIVEFSWNESGAIVSWVHLSSGREVVPEGAAANVLVLRQDVPAAYDAWDIDGADADAAGRVLATPTAIEVVDVTDLAATLRIEHRVGRSQFEQRVTMTAGTARLDVEVVADWHHDETRLQVEVPVDVLAREARCGTQFGHVMRPRHANTTWDAAKFEVCAHRYVHVSEPDFGVAILADGPRGYDVRGRALRLTLLRSPRYPDPAADRGRRTLRYSLWTHDGDAHAAGLEQQGLRLEHPLRLAASGVEPVVTIDRPDTSIVIGAVKRADDDSGDLIVRLWESRGVRATARLLVRDGIGAAASCDLLERQEHSLEHDGIGVAVQLDPFRIATVRIAR
jgi:alpha-mannosidase